MLTLYNIFFGKLNEMRNEGENPNTAKLTETEYETGCEQKASALGSRPLPSSYKN
jgi:hypothetical protein